MGTIQSGVGLVSGLNTSQLISQLISLERAPIQRLELRQQDLQTTNTAIKSLEANLLAITASVSSIGISSNFTQFNVSNSDPAQLTATANSKALPGTYQFQTIRRASSFQALSQGFANADKQAVGAGTLVIQSGGQLHVPTRLDSLNGGSGVQRGAIRVTDRAGNTADVDLSNAFTVDDVLKAINDQTAISVNASTSGGRIVLTDTTGSTASNLSVIELSGGTTAADLGIAQSVAADTLNGTDAFVVTGEFTLDQINDGNTIRKVTGAPELQITVADGTSFDVDLDSAFNLNDVISAIHTHGSNGGKVTAALVNGRLTLTDNTTGSETLAIADINGSSVVGALGLDVTASGNQITGKKLLAGINSVLLRNLRGGQGIDTLGQISVTDRAGNSATLDLSAAESLDEVLAAINTAETSGGAKLQLSAQVNATGTGIEIVDNSGASASNLVIADVGGSTLASQLGIAADSAETSVNSGALSQRFVNEASLINKYAPNGSKVSSGQIRITDSAGNVAIVNLSSAVKNIGDVLQRINAASGVSVRAELNETGDGFVLIDEAGGAGTLRVDDIDSDTAVDLRLTGDGVTGGDGKQRVTSRFAAVIEVDEDDTLDDVVTKINDSVAFVTASVFNDGSAFNSSRLSLTSNTAGSNGRLVIDDSGLNLGIATTSEAQDALLRVGPDAANGFLIASPNNVFQDAAKGVNVTTLTPGSTPAEVNVTRNDAKISAAIKSFVDGFNAFVKSANELTKYDSETQERGVLQGTGIVLRVRSRLDNLVIRRFSGFGDIDSLLDLGVKSRADGTLEFDASRLTQALQDDRAAVEDFLQRKDEGFGAFAKSVLDGLTDPTSGAFTVEENSLQQSIDSLTARIDQLDAILELKRDRLLRQFANMENILGTLTSQQAAISGIAPLSINPIGKGVF